MSNIQIVRERVNNRVFMVLQTSKFKFKRLLSDLNWLKIKNQSAVAFDNVGQQLADSDIFVVVKLLVKLVLLETDFFVRVEKVYGDLLFVALGLFG